MRPNVRDFLDQCWAHFVDMGYNKIFFPLPLDSSWWPLLSKMPALGVEFFLCSEEVLRLIEAKDGFLLILKPKHLAVLDLLATSGIDYATLTASGRAAHRKSIKYEPEYLLHCPVRIKKAVSTESEIDNEEPFFVTKAKLCLSAEQECRFMPLIAREIQQILDTAVIFTRDLECLLNAYVSVTELAIKGKSIYACFPGLHFFRRAEYYCLPGINLPVQQEKVRNLLIF